MSTHNIRTCLSRILQRGVFQHGVLQRATFRRGLHVAALLAASLPGLAHTGPAMAAEPHGVLHADDLDLSAPCAQLRIKVDPNLKDGMALEETSGLTPVIQTAHDGAESHLRVFLHNCPKGGRMTIRLSGDTALTLHDSPQAHITISGSLTTLESNLDDATLQVDRVESLDMSISGTTQVRIRQLDRAAQISASGAARLDVNTALLSALSAQLGDNSQLSIAQGQIDSLTLTSAQQSGASIMASINNASITTADASSIVLNKVTGTMQDGGTKHITHTTPPQAAATTAQTIQNMQDASHPPQPDGQAQGLNNPTLPHIPHQDSPSLNGQGSPAQLGTAQPVHPIQPVVPQSATHVANQPLPPAAPLAPTLRQGSPAASQPVTTNSPAVPVPLATAKPLRGKTSGEIALPPSTGESTQPQAVQAQAAQPAQPAHPATTIPAQPPVTLPSRAIPQTTPPQ